MKASGQLHIPGPFTQGKEPRYPMNRRLGDSFWKKIICSCRDSNLGPFSP